MPYLHNRYYYNKDKIPEHEKVFLSGYDIIESHPLFGKMSGDIYLKTKQVMMDGGACAVDKNGDIFVNVSVNLDSKEWAYTIAHALLHLAFGHFDRDRMYEADPGEPDITLWNKACDIYVTRFLYDVKFGKPTVPDPSSEYRIRLNDEVRIYSHLKKMEEVESVGKYGTNMKNAPDMIGLESSVSYAARGNRYAKRFSEALNESVSGAVSHAGGHDWNTHMETPVRKAAEWFLSHYPLLGGLAASFKIIEDVELCHKYEIHIAAVDPMLGEIYCNPTSGLSSEEWQFVLAHEYLHAGLMHHKRLLGRDKYLWNVACDYCVNGWLVDMKIGKMPEDVLFDKELKSLSAESIYDIIVKEMRKYKKLVTFRGFGHGDIMSDSLPRFGGLNKDGAGVSLDEFFKNALREGLDFHTTNGRGYLPAGLVEEIRALTSPAIPWEVELGQWFDCMFPPLEKHRSYARLSRRQGATPDIPRPRYIMQEEDYDDRTFGVVVDTSGSMSMKQLGLSLGAIASYAASKDVRFIRIVFCDAEAYDQGYLTPEDLAGRVKVTGRGGTILQPGVNLILRAKDFPADGPILIITDGYIESRLRISREHAFLLPKGNRLPFSPKGRVFYFA